MRISAIPILALSLTISAQDVFNSSSGAAKNGPTDCDNARARILAQYSQTVKQIDAERRDLTLRSNERLAACGVGDASKPCRDSVARDYDRQNEMLNQRVDRAGVDRDNALNRLNCDPPSPLRGGVDRTGGTADGGAPASTGPGSGRPNPGGGFPPGGGAPVGGGLPIGGPPLVGGVGTTGGSTPPLNGSVNGGGAGKQGRSPSGSPTRTGGAGTQGKQNPTQGKQNPTQAKGGATGTCTAGAGRNASTPVQGGDAYARGIADGLVTCAGGFINLAVAGAMIALASEYDQITHPSGYPVNSPAAIVMHTNWVQAAQILGVEPGGATILQRELAQHRAGVSQPGLSAYESGKLAGQRLCSWGVVPGLTKGILTKAYAPMGESIGNPLRGAALAKVMTASAAELPNASGKWISTPLGPIKLGAFKGKGSFSTVFEDANNPNRVVKVGNNTGGSPDSFARQKAGVPKLQKGGIDTPPIRFVDSGTATRPGVLITDNVFKRGPPVIQLSGEEIVQTPDALEAVRQVFDKSAAAGLVPGDISPSNIVLSKNAAGGLSAIVIDPDFFLPPEEYAASLRQGGVPGGVLSSKFWAGQLLPGAELVTELQNGKPVSACELSGSLFEVFKARYSVRGTSTNPTSVNPPRVNTPTVKGPGR